MKKSLIIFGTVFAAVLVISCASTASPASTESEEVQQESITMSIPVKKSINDVYPELQEVVFEPCEHYIFDEQGREIYYDGYETLDGYDQPNLWNNEKRITEYDAFGNITRFYRLNFKSPEEWFRSYYPDGSLAYSYGWEDEKSRFSDNPNRIDDYHEFWFDKRGNIIKKRTRIRTVDEEYNLVPASEEEEPAEYFEYDLYNNLIRNYDDEIGDLYRAVYDYDDQGNIIHNIKYFINYDFELEEWNTYNQDNKLVSARAIDKSYVDETNTELDGYSEYDLINTYRPDGLISSSKKTFFEYTDDSKKTITEQYVEEEVYKYDDKNRLVIHTTDTDSSNDKEDISVWEKYEYADDGSYVYTSNNGYRQSITQKNFSADGSLVYEKDFHGHETWYDEKGRIYRSGDYWIEYDDKGREVYTKSDGSVIYETWWHYDENDRLYGYEYLETHVYDRVSDKKDEVWITFDDQGFPEYILETTQRGLYSNNIESYCYERFFINKYSRYPDGTIKECLQYRYLNKIWEWIENSE